MREPRTAAEIAPANAAIDRIGFTAPVFGLF
jgi:hypothetical protein